jgi:sulfate permease, SulP family
VDRAPAQRPILRARGEEIYILQLQGFLFFGTASSVLEQVRRRLQEADRSPPRFVVIDFRQAHNLDVSAAISIGKLVQLAQRHNFWLLFSDLSAPMQQQLDREVLTDSKGSTWRIFPDMDHAVEWCEEQILQSAAAQGDLDVASSSSFEPSSHFLATLLAEPSSRRNGADDSSIWATLLMQYLERLEVEMGHYLIRQGDEPKGLYFIDSGQTTAQLELGDGRVVRLRTMQPGAIIGELGLYAGTAASASVVTLQTSVLYFLSTERLAQMEVEAPHLAAALHQAIARTVSERLMDATATVRTLMA